MKTHWKKQEGKTNHYIEVRKDEVCVWENSGSPMTEIGAVCNFKDFEGSNLEQIILNDFGEEVLGEVRKAIDKKK